MIAKDEAQVVRAFGAGHPHFRLFVFHGADEATARDLTAQFAAMMPADAERVDLDGQALAADPGRLLGEASSISMFGTPQWIRVTGGNEVAPAVAEALAGPKGHPIVIVTGVLRKPSALLDAVGGHGECLVYEAKAAGSDGPAMAVTIAGRLGLRLGRDVAALVVAQTAGDRALMASELEKMALYLDAAPDRPRPVERADVEAVGAAIDDRASVDLVRALFDAKLPALAGEVQAMASNAAIPTLRAVARHALLVARARRGGQLRAGPAERQMAETQSRNWDPAALATVHRTAMAAEAAVKTSGAGDVEAGHALLVLGRKAARLSR